MCIPIHPSFCRFIQLTFYLSIHPPGQTAIFLSTCSFILHYIHPTVNLFSTHSAFYPLTFLSTELASYPFSTHPILNSPYFYPIIFIYQPILLFIQLSTHPFLCQQVYSSIYLILPFINPIKYPVYPFSYIFLFIPYFCSFFFLLSIFLFFLPFLYISLKQDFCLFLYFFLICYYSPGCCYNLTFNRL